MLRLVLCFAVAFVALVDTSLLAEKKSSENGFGFKTTDWPWWRGVNRDGIAYPDQNPPLEWSESKNILWKASVPGRGHGSPTVVGKQVFLATADEEDEVQSVLCFDRKTGKRQWKTDVHTGGLSKKGNKKATQASSSVACDGERLFINFLNKGALHTTASSLDGNQLWQHKVTDYVVHQGYGSSPCVYGSLVIVSGDNKGGGAICGLDRESGKVIWKNERPKHPNYASPIILNVAGRDQLLFTGCNLVSSFEPLTGKTLWEIDGSTTECVTSIVSDGQCVFTSGGYPKNHMSAVKADGSGEIVWENKVRVYVPSMLAHDGYLYAIMDAGVATCWKSDTGQEVWKGRLGGVFTSSPVLVGENIYVTNEQGKTFIFKADPKSFELVAENELGDQVFATPVICDSRIYMRVAEETDDDKREEALYCIGSK